MLGIKSFLRFALVTAFLAAIVCSNQITQASTTEKDQQASEIMQQESSNPTSNTSSEVMKQPEAADHGDLLSSNENKFSIVDKLYQKIDRVRHRFSILLTYGTPLPPEKQKLLSDESRWQNEWSHHPLQLFVLLGSIFFTAFCVELFFKRQMARFLPAVASEGHVTWYKKFSVVMARATLDAGGLLTFLLSVVTILLFLPKDFRPGHSVVSSCLTAILIVKSTVILSRTLLAPDSHKLRILPITTDSASYIQRRVLAIANIGAFGWLLAGFIGMFSHLQSVSFLSLLAISLLVCCVLIIMCFEKRITVRNMLQNTLFQTKVMQEVARVWHHLAILYVVITWISCFFGLLLVGPRTIIPAGVTILAIPLFFLMDWLLQTLVDWWLQVSGKEPEVSPADSGETKLSEPVQPTSGLVSKAQLYSEGFTFGLRFVIRVVLAALFFFNLLSLWGIELQIGKVLTSAAMNTIVATLICVIIWGIVNRAIERKLKDELPGQGEESEEGGSGGSRTGTLLILFRKFLLSLLFIIAGITVLSSLGINIGPLIAGAGVIGLAIGFGAQTLVKDIISGIFFLMDDAFRVGEFVDTGSSQGVVEHISLRSLRIRHPRGMVHTIPFGDIPSVTNYSRDYIITKLDIRVPFDTDIDKVRKIVKKMYNDILSDEELGPKLLGKMKSQGVRDLDDSALVMRIKFKSIPGEQFVLRREVYRRLQEAFHNNGIEFASRKVMVQVPTENDSDSSRSQEKAAAAAALAAQNQMEPLDKSSKT